MKWFLKLERKYGKFAIPGLMNYIVVFYIIGLLLQWFAPGVFEKYFSLNAEMICRGQIWRLVTFLMDPPSTSIIFAAFMIYMYFQIGQVLEQIWGMFRFNVYFFMGMLGNIAAALLVYLIFGKSYSLGATYITMSLFLAYAATFPNMKFMIFYVIPVKAKWLAIADILLYAYMLGIGLLVQDWGVCIEIVMSLLNFIIFFIVTRNYAAVHPKVVRRRVKFKREMQIGKQRQGIHVCSVCGITDIDKPDMVFRYCSKCEGNHEYCSEHLYSHRHVTKNDMLNS